MKTDNPNVAAACDRAGEICEHMHRPQPYYAPVFVKGFERKPGTNTLAKQIAEWITHTARRKWPDDGGLQQDLMTSDIAEELRVVIETIFEELEGDE